MASRNATQNTKKQKLKKNKQIRQKQKQKQKQTVIVNVNTAKRSAASTGATKKQQSSQRTMSAPPPAYFGTTYVAPQNLDLLNSMITRDEIARTMENTIRNSMKEQSQFYDQQHRNALREIRMIQGQPFTYPTQMTANQYVQPTMPEQPPPPPQTRIRPTVVSDIATTLAKPAEKKESKAGRFNMWLTEREQKEQKENKSGQRLGGERKQSNLIPEEKQPQRISLYAPSHPHKEIVPPPPPSPRKFKPTFVSIPELPLQPTPSKLTHPPETAEPKKPSMIQTMRDYGNLAVTKMMLPLSREKPTAEHPRGEIKAWVKESMKKVVEPLPAKISQEPRSLEDILTSEREPEIKLKWEQSMNKKESAIKPVHIKPVEEKIPAPLIYKSIPPPKQPVSLSTPEQKVKGIHTELQLMNFFQDPFSEREETVSKPTKIMPTKIPTPFSSPQTKTPEQKTLSPLIRRPDERKFETLIAEKKPPPPPTPRQPASVTTEPRYEEKHEPRSNKKECPICGKLQSTSNMKRHIETMHNDPSKASFDPRAIEYLSQSVRGRHTKEI